MFDITILQTAIFMYTLRIPRCNWGADVPNRRILVWGVEFAPLEVRMGCRVTRVQICTPRLTALVLSYSFRVRANFLHTKYILSNDHILQY